MRTPPKQYLDANVSSAMIRFYLIKRFLCNCVVAILKNLIKIALFIKNKADYYFISMVVCNSQTYYCRVFNSQHLILIDFSIILPFFIHFVYERFLGSKVTIFS